MNFYVGRFRGIERREFEVEVITPLFLGGADPKKAELRAPSIKGAMRFWWRALHPHLSLRALKEKEAEIFGDAGEKSGKSKIRIRISKDLLYDGKSKKNPIPHRNVTFGFPCFNPGQIFSIKIFGTDKVFDMFQIVSILGGLGKRSRRGFGSFMVTKIDGTDIKKTTTTETILNFIQGIVGERFTSDNVRIIRTDKAHGDYPYIKRIEVGPAPFKTSGELLATIGQASHDNNSDYTGFARGQSRFSSPIYVSVIRSDLDNGYKPIITTLNIAFKPDSRNHGKDTSENFKKDIFSGGQR
ncbi:MAG: type III-B CRISPR module RAMP protein Cmr1 [Deltaproteobacteria bacterium]|nr:type III-B CRISPR module RAMP protein Cmr1 [Deltaproteobacteria bacterium]